MKRLSKTILAAAIAVGGLAAADAAPAQAATSCSAASYRPWNGTIFGGTQAKGYIQCTAPIYSFSVTVQVQKYTTNGWQNWLTPSATGMCTSAYYYWSCTHSVSAKPATPGTYRTVTSGWVKATPSSGWFSVTPRYSATSYLTG